MEPETMLTLPKNKLLTTLINAIAIGSMVTYLWIIGLLFMSSVGSMGGLTALLDEITGWMNPVFVQFNLALLAFMVLFTPLITYSYVFGMKHEKFERLHSELPERIWQQNETRIQKLIQRDFNIRNYLGSMSTTTIIIMFGASAILLLKPAPETAGMTGMDYHAGANFLLLGPYMNLYIDGDAQYLSKLTNSLIAFQFGFFGAFVHYLMHLVRSYFILDLTPNTFVLSSVRMVTGSTIALVLSFVVQDLNPIANKDNVLQTLPLISFFIGFFPSRGLNWIINIVSRTTGMVAKTDYLTTPISDLPGVNYGHELRLEREGFDNMQMLANANAVNLALHTGYPYNQLNNWIAQAQLAQFLTCDYRAFVIATGLSDLHEFHSYLNAAGEEGLAVLDKATDSKMSAKIQIIAKLPLTDPD